MQSSFWHSKYVYTYSLSGPFFFRLLLASNKDPRKGLAIILCKYHYFRMIKLETRILPSWKKLETTSDQQICLNSVYIFSQKQKENMLSLTILTMLVLDVQQTANIQINFAICCRQNEFLCSLVSLLEKMRAFRTSLSSKGRCEFNIDRCIHTSFNLSNMDDNGWKWRWTCCPERFSRSNRIKPWATRSGLIAWPCFEQELGREVSWGPFQPELSCGSMVPCGSTNGSTDNAAHLPTQSCWCSHCSLFVFYKMVDTASSPFSLTNDVKGYLSTVLLCFSQWQLWRWKPVTLFCSAHGTSRESPGEWARASPDCVGLCSLSEGTPPLTLGDPHPVVH